MEAANFVESSASGVDRNGCAMEAGGDVSRWRLLVMLLLSVPLVTDEIADADNDASFPGTRESKGEEEGGS